MGKLFIVGFGPGSREQMTEQARRALEAADVLCGYTVYLDLLRPLFPEKETFSTPMTRERERCRRALETAAAGRTVALVCGGDAGVYGMAGLALELAGERKDVEIGIVPGLTAALAGAALLGAPLMNDFCVISLSDLLTPWERIETRLRCAAAGGFSLCLYNPASRRRRDHLRRACDILLETLPAGTACGWARNIGRDGEASGVLTLGELRDFEADMFTTVFVGTAATRVIRGRLVTARGYEVER